ncbi:unnamed protein product [Vitrella brassicaformis CCMP3155]|uniref:ATP synthase subunit gamma n=1 Tax=Vitrella brassicaformis (strain CCMP3155) TaxID=1169540 RepID=A0A0G4H369_VITBC|nr:unnamed protein product [Vitrella brassicaformis CCMP3155]|eukprot:CEM37883.1 unnamed protein product [Vitrella brassicaformis CCMP3155]
MSVIDRQAAYGRSLRPKRHHVTIKETIDDYKKLEKVATAAHMISTARVQRAAAIWNRFKTFYQGITWMTRALLPHVLRVQQWEDARDMTRKEREEARAPREVGRLYRLLREHPQKRSAVLLLVGSDSGKCGGLNEAVLLRAKKRVIQLAKEGVEVLSFIVVGHRLFEQLKDADAGRLIIQQYPSGRQPDGSLAKNITRQMVNWYTEDSPRIDAAEAIFCRLKADGYREVALTPLLPVSIPLYDSDAFKLTTDHGRVKVMNSPLASTAPGVYDISKYSFYLQDEESVFRNLVPTFLFAQLLRAMVDSCGAEAAARMSSHDKRAQAIQGMIGDLEKEYIKAKQAFITRQVVEQSNAAINVEDRWRPGEPLEHSLQRLYVQELQRTSSPSPIPSPLNATLSTALSDTQATEFTSAIRDLGSGEKLWQTIFDESEDRGSDREERTPDWVSSLGGFSSDEFNEDERADEAASFAPDEELTDSSLLTRLEIMGGDNEDLFPALRHPRQDERLESLLKREVNESSAERVDEVARGDDSNEGDLDLWMLNPSRQEAEEALTTKTGEAPSGEGEGKRVMVDHMGVVLPSPPKGRLAATKRQRRSPTARQSHRNVTSAVASVDRRSKKKAEGQADVLDLRLGSKDQRIGHDSDGKHVSRQHREPQTH